MLPDPWYRPARLTLPPFKNKILQQKIEQLFSDYLGNDLHSYTVFTFATQCTSEDTAIQPACDVVIFTRSSICRTQAVQIFFCIDKAHVNAVSLKLHCH